MEPEVRHIPKTDFAKHRVVRRNGEVTIDGVYPERRPGLYMVRIRVPGGLITLPQARALADFADNFSDGTWHVDTRANVEYHGIAEDRLIEFVEAIETTGLSTRGACGDSVRNIVTGSESALADVSAINALVERLTRMFAGNPAFETLPRKFKIAFYAVDDREPLHRINDLGFVQQAGGPLRFEVWIGGGLGRAPRLGDLLFRNVPGDSVPGLVAAAVQLHNAHSNRRNRAQGRFKFVLEEHGLDQVREWILERWVPPVGVDLKPQFTPGQAPTRFAPTGVHAQDDGRFRVRVPLVAGDITGDPLRRVLDAAQAAGASAIQLSARQNFAITDVEAANVPALVTALERAGYPPSGWFGARDIVACPGATSCRKGFVETRDFALQLSDALESTPAPAWAKRLRISVSGCPNSCSQPQLYDIGFRGNAGKARGVVVKGYDLLVGGRLYGRTLLAQQFGSLLSADDVIGAATAAVRVFARLGRADEPFDALIDRVGLYAFARELAAEFTPAQGELAHELDVAADAPDAAEVLAQRTPIEVLDWAVRAFGDDLLVTSGLNAGGVLLAYWLRQIAPAHPVFVIDTGKLFPETHEYLQTLRVQHGLNLVPTGPLLPEVEFSARYGDALWQRDPELCCNIRKVQALAELRRGKRAWISAIRQEQGGERSGAPVLEHVDGLIGLVKIQPLALQTRAWIDEQLRTLGIPQHPLLAKGYRSIGCEPCTNPVAGHESERAGRWAGTEKTECGLHSRSNARSTT